MWPVYAETGYERGSHSAGIGGMTGRVPKPLREPMSTIGTEGSLPRRQPHAKWFRATTVGRGLHAMLLEFVAADNGKPCAGRQTSVLKRQVEYVPNGARSLIHEVLCPLAGWLDPQPQPRQVALIGVTFHDRQPAVGVVNLFERCLQCHSGQL